MSSQRGYVPPPYIPLEQSDEERIPARVADHVREAEAAPSQWSSGICACFDDMQSCCLGLFCPCFLFAKNAEFLGSGTLLGSCTTHLLLWVCVNSVCCMMTDGILLGLPGCFVAFYACSYRRALRAKYNLQEVPCGDLATHFCCHLCAICQEYREIRERAGDSYHSNLSLPVVTAPPVQSMESNPNCN